MTMSTFEYAVRGYKFVQYDGTNSADVLATYGGSTIVSEDDGVLVFESGADGPREIHIGERISSIGEIVSEADWAEFYLIKE